MYFFVGIWTRLANKASFHPSVMKLDFISQPSSKSNLPFEGLQHMPQSQVNLHSIFAPGFWSKWMVPENGLLSGGVWTHNLSVMSILP